MQNRYLLEMLVNFKMFEEELYENTLNKLHPQTLSKAYDTAWNNLEKFAGFPEGLPKPPDDSLLLRFSTISRKKENVILSSSIWPMFS